VGADFPVIESLRETISKQKDHNMHRLVGSYIFSSAVPKLLLVCGYALKGKAKHPTFGREPLRCFRGLVGKPRSAMTVKKINK